MANFKQAPKSLLTHSPVFLTVEMRAELAKPGTYNIFKLADNRLKISIGNTTWKGEQAKLIGMWGGDEAGNRLEVTAEPPIVDVSLLSEHEIEPHLTVWLIKAMAGGATGETHLYARTKVALPGKPAGAIYSSPLPVSVLDEVANAGPTGSFAGGTRQETVDAIKEECRRQGVTLNNQIAYILATAEWESRFTPIRERFTPAHEPQRRGLAYYPYYGRGYVQLTHEGNYKKYADLLGVDMVADPDLALQADIALYVLVHGMMNGVFGRSLPQYVNKDQTDFLHARHCVNVMDQAQTIADMADKWLRTLVPPAPQGKR